MQKLMDEEDATVGAGTGETLLAALQGFTSISLPRARWSTFPSDVALHECCQACLRRLGIANRSTPGVIATPAPKFALATPAPKFALATPALNRG
jgi:hypothetical protein